MNYQHTQVGRTLLLIMMCTLFVLIIMSFSLAHVAPLWAVIVLISIVTILFSSLTIKVSDEKIAWHFGPGFWKKSIALNDVVAVRRIETKLYHGFGIRMVASGWLYNVSGSTAVELQLRNRTTVWLGTDDADNLISAINKNSQI